MNIRRPAITSILDKCEFCFTVVNLVDYGNYRGQTLM